MKIEYNAPSRHGRKAKVPKINKSSSSHNQSLYDSSFAVLGSKLWNCLPVLDAFKHEVTKLLFTIPDIPPVGGYVDTNNNSVLHWYMNRAKALLLGRSQKVMTLSYLYETDASNASK